MRKWLRRWLNKDSNEVCEDSRPLSLSSGSNKVRAHYEDDNSINFRIYGATGGKIVETTRFDSKLGREKTNLYIIGDDEEFHSSLSKIITIEYIR